MDTGESDPSKKLIGGNLLPPLEELKGQLNYRIISQRLQYINFI